MKYKYTGNNEYAYSGEISVDGNTVTFTYGAAEVSRTNFMNDVARFLGALVYGNDEAEDDDGEVTMTIERDGKTYEWDNSEDNDAKGSKWFTGESFNDGSGEDSKKGDSNTLVYHIFGTSKEQTEETGDLIPAAFPDVINLTVDGESVTIVRQ